MSKDWYYFACSILRTKFKEVDMDTCFMSFDFHANKFFKYPTEYMLELYEQVLLFTG